MHLVHVLALEGPDWQEDRTATATRWDADSDSDVHALQLMTAIHEIITVTRRESDSDSGLEQYVVAALDALKPSYGLDSTLRTTLLAQLSTLQLDGTTPRIRSAITELTSALKLDSSV